MRDFRHLKVKICKRAGDRTIASVGHVATFGHTRCIGYKQKRRVEKTWNEQPNPHIIFIHIYMLYMYMYIRFRLLRVPPFQLFALAVFLCNSRGPLDKSAFWFLSLHLTEPTVHRFSWFGVSHLKPCLAYIGLGFGLLYFGGRPHCGCLLCSGFS